MERLTLRQTAAHHLTVLKFALWAMQETLRPEDLTPKATEACLGLIDATDAICDLVLGRSMNVGGDPVLEQAMAALEPCCNHLRVMQAAKDFGGACDGAVLETARALVGRCQKALGAAEDILISADKGLEDYENIYNVDQATA